jgi:microsomal dipeptidase-like Zn-dependent dipeptidase
MRRRVVAVALALAATAAPASASSRVPRSRFDFANRCLAARASEPLFFKATGLGTYMIGDAQGRLVTGAATRGTEPGIAAEWRAARVGRGLYTLRSSADGRLLALGGRTRLRFAKARGCRPYPELEVGATGKRARGIHRDGTVFGYADAHVHVTADLRAGGRTVSGAPFDRFGVTEALGHDADVHGSDGRLDTTGNLLRGGSPAATHDTHGWPTFAGWPTYDTYTHQQVYYRWLERDWMAGERLLTAQLVEDQPLCEIEPQKSHSCDETQTIELEAQELRGLQDYVDAQSGGPGEGWLRVVSTPQQARRAIRRGKLAVLLGVESSNPFGCSESLGRPQCTTADVDRGIGRYKRLGISGMFIAHWVDNAFAGAALESGSKGQFIAAFNVVQTGRPFLTGPCPEAGQGDSCNGKGLTELGAYLVQRLMDGRMLIELDHLSEKARLQVLALAEARHYAGVISSHTDTGGFWTPSDLERLYALGGFATARPDTAAKLAATIGAYRRYERPGRFIGVGLGSDTGGFNALPEPDPDAARQPLTYPFRSFGGRVRFGRQVAGRRTYDLNRDGVANYGLFADLLAATRRQPGGATAMTLLFRSAEAYLRTWEAALRA